MSEILRLILIFPFQAHLLGTSYHPPQSLTFLNLGAFVQGPIVMRGCAVSYTCSPSSVYRAFPLRSLDPYKSPVRYEWQKSFYSRKAGVCIGLPNKKLKSKHLPVDSTFWSQRLCFSIKLCAKTWTPKLCGIIYLYSPNNFFLLHLHVIVEIINQSKAAHFPDFV